MGATNFHDSGVGKSANDVFGDLVDEATWEHGHGGYTGTIAEKPGFRMFEPPKGMSVRDFINAVDSYDPDNDKDAPYEVRQAYKVYDDKWGPAVCVKEDIEGGLKKFHFFGYASE
jgi:hypothetical protein